MDIKNYCLFHAIILCLQIIVSCVETSIIEEKIEENPYRYKDILLNIAYSQIDDGNIINTKNHFVSACLNGFNSLKADLRLTKDNRLVLCHDAGFTLDTNHKIDQFDRNNYFYIRDLTAEEIVSLEFSDNYSDDNPIHPMLLDSLIVLCRQFNVVPFLTIRNEYIEETLDELFRVLVRYSMLDETIINIFPPNNTIVDLIRKQSNIPLCYTLGTTTDLDDSLVSYVDSIGNMILCIYYDRFLEISDSAFLTLRNYKQGFYIWYPPSKNDYLSAQAKGCIGAQITKCSVIQ